MSRWWKVQEAGDSKPVAVFFLEEGDVLRRFVPGEGLVDWPPAAMWVLGDSPGATEIDEAEAVKLMKAGTGTLPEKVETESCRGDAPTLPTPDAVKG